MSNQQAGVMQHPSLLLTRLVLLYCKNDTYILGNINLARVLRCKHFIPETPCKDVTPAVFPVSLPACHTVAITSL